MVQSTGFTFGAKTTAPPAFGTGSITFGTPSTQSQGTFGFGTPPNPQTTTGGFQFTATTTSAPATNLFGSSATNLNVKPSGFGTPLQPTGLFGTPASTTPAGGISFGAPSNAAPSSIGLGFGATATTSAAPPGGLSFGTPAASTAAGSTGLFSTPTASVAPTLSFGASATPATGLSFGTTKPSVSVGGTPFATTTTAAGFGFGTSTSNVPTLGTSTTTAGLTFGIGAANPTTSTSFGLGGSTAASKAAPLSFGTTTSAPLTVGLGGLASSSKTGASVTTQKEIPPKDQPLPNEIVQTVEQFKELVKQQKLHSSDIARCSVRDFKKVEQEIDLLNNLLREVESQLQKNRHLAEKLKYDTAKCLQNVEMAQRTQDTPPGLQYENTAPLKYFLELADQFEKEMAALKIQIETADKYVKNNRNPDSLTPQDLAVGMRRLHETFVALAGRLHSVHNQVETQKETYLNIRKQIFHDPSNPFEKLSKPAELNLSNLTNALIYSPPKVATGPTPFNNLALGNGNPLLQQQNQQAPYPGTSTSVAPSGFGGTVTLGTQMGTQSTSAFFGSTPFGQSSFGTSLSNFQLQKPPTGNKRGKQ